MFEPEDLLRSAGGSAHVPCSGDGLGQQRRRDYLRLGHRHHSAKHEDQERTTNDDDRDERDVHIRRGRGASPSRLPTRRRGIRAVRQPQVLLRTRPRAAYIRCEGNRHRRKRRPRRNVHVDNHPSAKTQFRAREDDQDVILAWIRFLASTWARRAELSAETLPRGAPTLREPRTALTSRRPVPSRFVASE